MQLHALQPTIFNNRYAFEVRYCNGHQSNFGWDAQGSSNEAELKCLLENLGKYGCDCDGAVLYYPAHFILFAPLIDLIQPVMVRRLKKDVMEPGELPPKHREFVNVPTTPGFMQQITTLMREKDVSQIMCCHR